MSLPLPKPIADYFHADQGGASLDDCFAENAVVKDEGHTYEGLPAIRRWRASSSKKYTYTSVPMAVETKADRTIVTSRLTGNFPGSPVDLRYSFGLVNDRIVVLEIGL